MATSSTEITSLEASAHEQVVKKLGELAESITSRFSCGGVLSSPSKVQLAFKQGSDEWAAAGVVFPGADEAAIQQLLSACSVASFGMGSKKVTDKSYRDAFKLEPDRFATTFQLCDTPILGEIQMLMVPDVCAIRADLYKLNIYAPGGHFKAHVDTPRSERMFGSLVVCLPTQFCGGALITRHDGREVPFDWSSSLQNPLQSVCWAAFFSDVEHEVFPVTEGYRVTLTYNLYSNTQLDIPGIVSIVDVTSNPFYNELRLAISNPHFMRDGGVLGFSCHHAYVFKDLNVATNLPCLLKGSDRIVYVAVKSLGLPVVVKPVDISSEACHWPRDLSDLSEKCQRDAERFVLPEFTSFKHDQIKIYDKPVREIIKSIFGTSGDFKDIFGSSGTHHVTKITWCQEFTDWLPAAAYSTYGNEPSCEVLYQAAAILVGIPKWGERQTGAPEIGQKRVRSRETASASKAVKR